MKWNDRLRQYIKIQGISQKEAAILLNTSPSMMSRYLSGSDNINQDFIINLLKAFPEIDLQSIFSENKPIEVEEPDNSEFNIEKELLEIQDKISKIREHLAQDCHDKIK